MLIYNLLFTIAAVLTGCGGGDDDSTPAAITITASPEQVEAPAAGGSYTVSVSTTGKEWGAYADGEFIKLSTDGTLSQKGSITVTVAENPFTEERTGSVTIMSGAARKTISVHQAAAEKPGYNAPDGYQLVWNDEFDYQGAPDESKWSFDTQGNNWDWGNDEAQNYTPKENKNAWVEDGNLIIEARKEPYRWYGDGQTKEYTSARLRTLGKGDWLYGKVEVRALLPKGRGMWPAIWMLASEEKYGGWPKSGELDIMENVGYDPNKIHCNIHTGAYNHSIGTNKGNTVSTSLPSENWHVYSMEWDAEKVIFFLDGEQVFRFDNEHKTFQEWPYDQKFHLLLNIAVGGSWGGEQGIDNSVFPQRMLVDYVRVYQMGEVDDNTAAGIVRNHDSFIYQCGVLLHVVNGVAGSPYRIVSPAGGILISGRLADDATVNVENLAKGYYLLSIDNKSFPFIKE